MNKQTKYPKEEPMPKEFQREQMRRTVLCPNCESRRVSYIADKNRFQCGKCSGYFPPDMIEDFEDKPIELTLTEKIIRIERYLTKKFIDFKDFK